MGILITVLAGFVAALPLPWLHRRGSTLTGWIVALLPLSLTVYLVGWIPRVAEEESIRVVYEWVPGLDVNLTFLIDGLSLFFALLICGVGTAIFVYSSDYIKHHRHAGRFYSYMLVFMASMLGLVLADNVFALYVFFELTSVASFLLIGFEHEEGEARRSAWQALIVTGAGGLALLAGVILLGLTAGSFEVSQMLGEGAALRSAAVYPPALILVLLACFTKSAQFPFYFWLPNAMEAPTPVSAYLHSATMVKAGIYVLARFSPILGGTDLWTVVVTATGAFTMLVSSYLALRDTDIKRILAYSTIMALGLLTMLLGIGSEAAVLGCMAFILVHALYKAPLFMVAGTLDHEAGTYDLDHLGGLRSALPVTFAAAVLAGLSMAGMFPFLGFVGKETVFKALLDAEVAHVALSVAAVLANAAVVAVAGIVALRPFLGTARHPADDVHRAPMSLWLGPLFLAAFGLLAGLVPGFLSEHVVHPATAAVMQEAPSDELRLWQGLTPEFGLSLASIAVGIVLYLAWSRLHGSAPMRTFSAVLGEGLDRAYDGAVEAVLAVGRWQTGHLQNGILRHYVASAVGMGTLLIAYSVVRGRLIGWPDSVEPYLAHEVGVAGLILVASLAVILVARRFTAVLSLSAAGFGMAILFLLFGAPDVAMVQLLIEALTLILVVLALIDMPETYREPDPDRFRFRNLIISLGAGAVVTVLMLAILQIPLDRAVSDFYVAHSLSEGHGRNVVNVILVDFRALDTLGEVTVLAVAGLSAYALVQRRQSVALDDHDDAEEADSDDQ